MAAAIAGRLGRRQAPVMAERKRIVLRRQAMRRAGVWCAKLRRRPWDAVARQLLRRRCRSVEAVLAATRRILISLCLSWQMTLCPSLKNETRRFRNSRNPAMAGKIARFERVTYPEGGCYEIHFGELLIHWQKHEFSFSRLTTLNPPDKHSMWRNINKDVHFLTSR
jgi:hypothetical protein